LNDLTFNKDITTTRGMSSQNEARQRLIVEEIGNKLSQNEAREKLR